MLMSAPVSKRATLACWFGRLPCGPRRGQVV